MTLIQEFAPALFLLVAALLLFGGTRMARHFGSPEALGCGVALCIIAIAIGLSPATWRAAWAGGAWGDRLLTYARIVGVIGILFLAGTRFDVSQSRKKFRSLLWIGFFGILLLPAVTLLLKFFGEQHSESALLIAATIVASGLWYPAQLLGYKKQKEDLPGEWLTAAAVLSALAMLAVYSFDIFTVAGRARPSVPVYVVVALYEALKLVMLFAFAYFILTRFLARAEGRISRTRTTIAFVLMASLVFVLAATTTNQLAAFAWAFMAGALWRRTEIGLKFGKSDKPLASAMLISLAFIPLMLQAHGRNLNSWLVLLVLILVAIAVKTVFVWLALKAGDAAIRASANMALVMALPGEMAVVFLGFGMTRWVIEAPVYFGILGYSLLSSVLIPWVWHVTVAPSRLAVTGRKRNVMKSRMKTVFSIVVLSLAIVAFSSTSTSAQQAATVPPAQQIELGTGMSVITPGLMEIGSKTRLFLVFGDKIALTAEQRKKLEDLYFRLQMYSVQREADLDVADAELKRLLTRDTVNLGAVKAKMKEIEAIRVEVDIKKIETLLQAINALTHEQHTQVILLAREVEEANKPRAPIYQ